MIIVWKTGPEREEIMVLANVTFTFQCTPGLVDSYNKFLKSFSSFGAVDLAHSTLNLETGVYILTQSQKTQCSNSMLRSDRASYLLFLTIASVI